MKWVSVIFILLASMATAEDKIPLRFPLGLQGGISKDSVSSLLKLKGIKYKGQRSIGHHLSFGLIRVANIRFGYFHDKLMDITLITDTGDSGMDPDPKQQLNNLGMTADFIERNYDCVKTLDLMSDVQPDLGSDKAMPGGTIDDTLMEFTASEVVCFVRSVYNCLPEPLQHSKYNEKQGWFWIAISFVDRKLMSEFLEESKEQKLKLELKSKKDL